MKLYYSPGSCSLAVHVTLRDLELPVALERVDLRTGLVGGRPFNELNPKGYVPALQLDSGEMLTEGAALQQYLADLKPELNLIPRPGTLERFRCIEWLTYVSTELHKAYGPLWAPNTPEDIRAQTITTLGKKFTFLSQHLRNKPFLMGDRYTVADAYLFTVLNWNNYLKIDTAPWPELGSFMARMHERPAVRAAWEAESLKGG